MKRIFVLGVFLATCSIISCTTDQQQIDEQHAIVMQIHDEVMPKLTEMNKLSRSLKEMMGTKDSISAVAFQNVIQELEDANKAMFDWMEDYNKPSSETELDKALAYLDSQENKITLVRDLMLTSIQNAKTQLSK